MAVIEADGLGPTNGTYRPVLHVRVSSQAAEPMRHMANAGVPLRMNGVPLYFLPFTVTRPRARTSIRPSTAYAAAHETLLRHRGRGWVGGHVQALLAKRTPLGPLGPVPEHATTHALTSHRLVVWQTAQTARQPAQGGTRGPHGLRPGVRSRTGH